MGEQVSLTVTVLREEEDADEDSLNVFKTPVFAQFYPTKKFEEWWVVVGNSSTGKLLAIKKISNFREQQQVSTQLGFTADNEQIKDLKVFLVCDSYIGCDL